MPTISILGGIVVSMYYNDHPPPHFHAYYQGHRALVTIEDGAIARGSLPLRVERKVRGWALLRQEELLANWQRAQDDEPLERIAGPGDD